MSETKPTVSEHKPNCPRIQFWDGGEYEVPCLCKTTKPESANECVCCGLAVCKCFWEDGICFYHRYANTQFLDDSSELHVCASEIPADISSPQSGLSSLQSLKAGDANCRNGNQPPFPVSNDRPSAADPTAGGVRYYHIGMDGSLIDSPDGIVVTREAYEKPYNEKRPKVEGVLPPESAYCVLCKKHTDHKTEDCPMPSSFEVLSPESATFQIRKEHITRYVDVVSPKDYKDCHAALLASQRKVEELEEAILEDGRVDKETITDALHALSVNPKLCNENDRLQQQMADLTFKLGQRADELLTKTAQLTDLRTHLEAATKSLNTTKLEYYQLADKLAAEEQRADEAMRENIQLAERLVNLETVWTERDELRAENERLREALEKIVNDGTSHGASVQGSETTFISIGAQIAKAALDASKDK